MQDKELETVNNQRRRRKRIGRMKKMIIFTVTGWILASMVLIVVLFGKVVKMEQAMNDMVASMQTMHVADSQKADLNQAANEDESDIILVSAMDDEANRAEESDVHKVYLTFEDGPTANTEAILDILKAYDVKATFFVMGKEDEASMAIYKRIVDEGHTIGMHSHSNKYSVIYQSVDAFEDDYNKLQSLIYEATGVESKFYRFPGGSGNQISETPMGEFIQFLNEKGIVYYDWNVTSGDATANAYSAEEIVANVTNDVVKYKTSVVLLHDGDSNSVTVEALEPLLISLQEMGAEVLPIDEDTSVVQYMKISDAE